MINKTNIRKDKMRYTYKVFDMTEPKPEGEGRPFKMMYNMSLKRLQKTLDPKRSYQVEYKNKRIILYQH